MKIFLVFAVMLLLTACTADNTLPDRSSTPTPSATGGTPTVAATAEAAASTSTPVDPTPAPPTATVTVEPTATMTPTAMPEPTATVPPTATPEPVTPTPEPEPTFQQFSLPEGSRPHDVAPGTDGTVWYTAQGSGAVGRLDPASGTITEIALGAGSAPHGVIVGPDDAAWITDAGLNAIVRIDPGTEEVTRFAMPTGRDNVNLNTATFDGNGTLWFTGQNGVYGSLNSFNGEVVVYDAPEGRGPYGITTTPDGDVYYASLAGNHIARIDIGTGEATVIEPPTQDQGARRVWSDSQGRIWVSEWSSGQVSVYDPADESWQQWRLPGDNPQPYAVYVDERDIVWLSDFGSNALIRFDPATETFESYPLPGSPSNVRQILGRPGEIWGAESGVNRLVVLLAP